MIIAPVLGVAVDSVGSGGVTSFWPVGLLGMLLAGVMLLTAKKRGETE